MTQECHERGLDRRLSAETGARNARVRPNGKSQIPVGNLPAGNMSAVRQREARCAHEARSVKGYA